jgi:predicted permease
MIRWSYGYRLLRKQEPELFIIPDDNVSDPSTCFDTKTAKLSSCSDIESGSDGESTLSVKRGGMPGRQLSAVTITVDESTSLLHPNNNKKTVLSSSSSISRTPSLLTTRNPFNTFAKTIHSFMSPPLYAASLALIVGLSPLKPFLFDKSAFLYPSFTKAIETCGRAAVPLILTCLGAQLAHISQTRHAANNNEKKPVATAIFVRMILMPCLIIPMMILFIKYGAAYSSLATDPVFIVMMIILGCTPTALNLVQITQLNNVFEEEMVRLLFWSYGVVCIPICTFVVFISLNIVNTFL